MGRAIAEHYLPRLAGGDLPASPAGIALSLAEKFDNLCACFSVGLVPSGSADPYALRRQSQAILRIVRETGLFFPLSGLVRAALGLLPEKADRSDATVDRVMGFLRDRLLQMCVEAGLEHDLVRAALTVGFDCLNDFWLRVGALKKLSGEPVWPDLVACAERTYNISRALDEGDGSHP